MPRALLSVSDKTGLIDFARGLSELGWELVSTGGTARAARRRPHRGRTSSDVTGFPEMLDGRVKTLHPAVHGGLLARRDLPEHMAAIAEHGIEPIDLVAVNLYPFRETASRAGRHARRRHRADRHRRAEHAALGGEELRVGVGGRRSGGLRARARVARRRATTTSTCAACSRRRCSRTPRRTMRRSPRGSPRSAASVSRRRSSHRSSARSRCATARTPGRRAAFYVERAARDLAALEQRGGKELSFNNLLDLEGALLATDPFVGRVCVRDREAHDAVRLGDRHVAARRVPEGARVRSRVRVRIGDRVHGSRRRRGGGGGVESVRRVHRGAVVQRRRASRSSAARRICACSRARRSGAAKAARESRLQARARRRARAGARAVRDRRYRRGRS